MSSTTAPASSQPLPNITTAMASQFSELGSNLSGLFGGIAAAAAVAATPTTATSERVIPEQEVAQAGAERRNLLHVFKLAIKNMLEFVDHGEPVTDESPVLSDFCLIIENVFKHGLRRKSRSMFVLRDKTYWDFIAEGLEKNAASANIIVNVKSLSGLKTQAGRGRAFIWSALMEGKLADYWAILLENADHVNNYYETYALLRHDDIVPITGMLVGLAVIDFNLYLRGDYLEKLPDTIEWSKYLRIQYAPVPTSAPAAAPAAVSLAFATPAAVIAPTVSYAVAGGGSDANGEEHEHEQQLLHAVTEVAEEKDEATVTAEATAAAEGEAPLIKSRAQSQAREEADNSAQEASAASAAVAAANSALEQTQRKLAATLDQKSYLEELKRKAEVKLHETTEKLEKTQAAHQALETEHRSQQEQLSILTLSVDALQTELQQARLSHKREADELHSTLENERAVFRASKDDTSQLTEGIRNTLTTETKLRETVERELNLERQKRQADKEQSSMQLASLQSELQQAQDDKDAFKKSIEMQQEQIEGLAKQRDAKQQEIDDITKALADVREELKETKIKLAVASKSKKEAKALKGELDTSIEKTAELTKQLDASRAETQAALTERDEKDRRLLGAVDRLDETNRLLDAEREVSKREQAQSASLLAELDDMRQQLDSLQQDIQEREDGFTELAKKLESSQLKLSDLNEFRDRAKGNWVDDRTVNNCSQCNDKFSVNRRKHHCRSCGGIFCASCSNNKMTLPSSKKPVRVCDGCHTRLLQSFSAS